MMKKINEHEKICTKTLFFSSCTMIFANPYNFQKYNQNQIKDAIIMIIFFLYRTIYSTTYVQKHNWRVIRERRTVVRLSPTLMELRVKQIQNLSLCLFKKRS